MASFDEVASVCTRQSANSGLSLFVYIALASYPSYQKLMLSVSHHGLIISDKLLTAICSCFHGEVWNKLSRDTELLT